jgi:hypothetical protein
MWIRPQEYLFEIISNGGGHGFNIELKYNQITVFKQAGFNKKEQTDVWEALGYSGSLPSACSKLVNYDACSFKREPLEVCQATLVNPDLQKRFVSVLTNMQQKS